MRIVTRTRHYPKKYLHMTNNGRQYIALCGWDAAGKSITKDVSKVLCGSCLRILNKRKK